jgi:hypothetical protein
MRGNQVRIDPEWIPSDPGMVQVVPIADDAVRITVTRPGESTLKLVAHRLTRDLTIRATHDGAAMQVAVMQ